MSYCNLRFADPTAAMISSAATERINEEPGNVAAIHRLQQQFDFSSFEFGCGVAQVSTSVSRAASALTSAGKIPERQLTRGTMERSGIVDGAFDSSAELAHSRG